MSNKDPTLEDWLKQNKIKCSRSKLEEEEYVTVQDIREIEPHDVDEVIGALGLKKKSALAFKKAHAQLCQPRVRGNLGEEKYDNDIKTPERFELTSMLKDSIIRLVNTEMPKDQIVETLAPVKGARQDAISHYIDTLIRKPKRKPIGTIRCGVRLAKGDPSLPLFHYNGKEIRGQKYHTFLVLGETGAGKTTLLDAFVNCIGDISYNDTWRWKLVNEDKMKKKGQGVSMTDNISYYYLNDKRSTNKPYHVRIIDTPGFGDSRGMKYDEKIVEQFENLFKNKIEELDWILLVVKGTITRWTPSARYVYDRVQQVFGKDATDRFVLMCTFADGGTPNALAVLQGKLHWQEYFTFNNSAIYTPSGTPHSKKNNTKFYWDMAMNSVTEFLKFAQDQNLPPLSLNNAREVIETRKALYMTIKFAQDKINLGLEKLECLSRVMKDIGENKDNINKLGKYEMMIPETYLVRTPLGKTSQFCERCQVSCCETCEWPKNATESQCTYFRQWHNYLCICGCPKDTHIRSKERVVKKTRMVVSVYKTQVDQGWSNISFSKRCLNQIHKQMMDLGKEILGCMQKVNTSMEKLERIALKPKVFTADEYFTQMIEHEIETKNPGWSGRVEGLKMIAERAKGFRVITEMDKSGDFTKLSPQYQELISQASKETGVKSNCSVM